MLQTIAIVLIVMWLLGMNGAKHKGMLAEAIRNDFGTFENLQ